MTKDLWSVGYLFKVSRNSIGKTHTRPGQWTAVVCIGIFLFWILTLSLNEQQNDEVGNILRHTRVISKPQYNKTTLQHDPNHIHLNRINIAGKALDMVQQPSQQSPNIAQNKTQHIIQDKSMTQNTQKNDINTNTNALGNTDDVDMKQIQRKGGQGKTKSTYNHFND